MTDKELLLKKTARRRLVGAITLVVLMLIVLPFVLKDRVADNAAQEAVHITVVNQQEKQQPILELPEDEQALESAANNIDTPATSSATQQSAGNASRSTADASVSSDNTSSLAPSVVKPATLGASHEIPAAGATTRNEAPQSATPAKLAQAEPLPAKPTVAKSETKAETKAAAAKTAQEAQPAADKQSGKFYVQFGVFSDPKNLDSLKQKLSQAGVHAMSENVDAAGQKMRLRSEVYNNKAAAAAALKRIQAAGFSGIVAKS